jgi:hypothetical protein
MTRCEKSIYFLFCGGRKEKRGKEGALAYYRYLTPHSILITMETINTMIKARPITPIQIGPSGTRCSTSHTSLTGISESSRNSSPIVERTKNNRDESMPQPRLLHFELEQLSSSRNLKGVSPDKAASVVRALAKAASSSVPGTARDLSFFNDVLDQAINAEKGQTSEMSNEFARTSNSYDKSNLSLSQLVDLLGKNSRNIIQRQQDEIRCLRLAVKELVGAVLDEGEIPSLPDVIEFQSLSEEEEKTRSLATDRSPAVVSIRSDSSHSHDIVPRGNYTQENTDILASKGSFESNLSFQNDGNEDNEESADIGEYAQLEIPGDATQPLDLSIIALSVDGEQMDHGKTERGALDIQNTPEDHAGHEEEPSPINDTHHLSNCYQEQEGDQALHSVEAQSLPLTANETETEENDMGFTETKRSSLTDQTESTQQHSLLGVGRHDSGESEYRPPRRHLEVKPTSEAFAREIVEDILQQAVNSGAMKESFADRQCSSHSDVSHSDEVEDDLLSVGPGFANLVVYEAIELPEELTLDLSASFFGIASQIPEELPSRELPSLNQTDEEIREQSLESGHDTHVPVNTCVGDAVDSGDDHSEHSTVLEQSSDSVSPGSPDPAETIDRKDADGGLLAPLHLSNETDEEITEESTNPEHIITDRTIGEEDTEAGHDEAAKNTVASSCKPVSTEESRGPERVETGVNVDVPAESAKGGSSSDDVSKQARAISSERALDDNDELPGTNNSGPLASSRQSFGPDHTKNIENPLVFHQQLRTRRNFPDDEGDAHPDTPYRPPTDFDRCMSLETTMYIRESEPSCMAMPSSDAESWEITEEKNTAIQYII